MNLHAYVVDIYEAAAGDKYPVVQHEFYGRTKDEATGYFQAHMGTDSFMRDCVEEGQWKDVNCRAVGVWRLVEGPLEPPVPIGKKKPLADFPAFVLDIYEQSVGDAYPVVRHVFYGEDRAEALGYYSAHLSADAFMKGCAEHERWQDIDCRSVARWFENLRFEDA
jgi:hypothetical protein